MAVLLGSLLLHPHTTKAIPYSQGSSSQTQAGVSTISSALPGVIPIAANNAMVVFCGVKATSAGITISSPAGFTKARENTFSGLTQAIFFKTTTGSESTITCDLGTTGSAFISIHYYTGMITPFNGVINSGVTSVNDPYSVGSVSASSSSGLILANYIASTATPITSWSNQYQPISSGGIFSGSGPSRFTWGNSALITTAPVSYTSAAVGGGRADAIGQQIYINAHPSTLTASFVDTGGGPVGNPAISFSARPTTFSCQTSTATLGLSAQKIRVLNRTANGNWSLSLAATGGNAATWTNGSNTYTYNNPADSGCASGMLSVNPSTSTLSPIYTDCTNTGLTRGTAGTYNNPSVSSITILSAASTKPNCGWDITGIGLTQTIPAETKAGTYSLNMTLTAVSS